MPTKTEATIEDLYHVPEDGKAEVVNGELQLMSPRRFAWQRSILKLLFLCALMRDELDQAVPMVTTSGSL